MRIIQIYKESEFEEKQLDDLLLKEQQEINSEIDKECQQFLATFKMQFQRIH